MGLTPLIASLLQVHQLDPSADGPLERAGALAFTSANAVRAFAAWSLQRHLPVFAVGDATAMAARDIGFAQVDSAGGDVGALVRLIAARRHGGAILHPCAREAAGDLVGDLARGGAIVESVALYETVSLAPSAEAADAWAHGRVDAVLLHSPKAARALAGWLSSREHDSKVRARALGLSPACTAPLPAACFTMLQAASEANEEALLALLA